MNIRRCFHSWPTSDVIFGVFFSILLVQANQRKNSSQVDCDWVRKGIPSSLFSVGSFTVSTNINRFFFFFFDFQKKNSFQKSLVLHFFAGVLFQKRITGNKNYINFVFVFLSRRILAPLNKSHFLLWYIGCSFCAKKKKIKKASGII